MLYAILQDIYTAEMILIYMLVPLYLAYRFASVPVEEYSTERSTLTWGRHYRHEAASIGIISSLYTALPPRKYGGIERVICNVSEALTGAGA